MKTLPLLFLVVTLGGTRLSSADGTSDPGISSGQLSVHLDLANSRILVSERETGRILATQEAPIFSVATPESRTRITRISTEGGTLRFKLDCPKPSRDCLGSGEVSFLQPAVVQFHYRTEGKGIRVPFVDQGEHYYGVWETALNGSLDNRGQEATYEGTAVAPDVNYSSARAPFYLTSGHYGIYVPATTKGRFYFAYGESGDTGFEFPQPELVYDFVYGPSYGEILSRYNALAGAPRMPPLWAFGSGWWEDDLHRDLHHHPVWSAQANAMDDLEQLRKRRIPAAWYWFDRPYGTGGQGWGNFDFDSSFPDPQGMLNGLHQMGYKALAWIANKAWDPSRLWEEGTARHYLYADRSGCGADLAKPEAYRWLRGLMEAFPAMGIDGFKIDRGEEGEDCVPDRQLNTANDALAALAGEALRARLGQDYYEFARNLADTGRRDAAVWGGDAYSTFGGLRTSLKEGLRAGLIDFPMWGSDTGGIQSGHCPLELFARWFAVSAFSPMMEIMIGTYQTPWYDYGKEGTYPGEMTEIARAFSSLHHDLIPYTRSMMYLATRTGMPVMRALFLTDPEDPVAARMDDEYQFGSELLVAPIVEEGARERGVYLPQGKWLNYDDRSTVYSGPETVSLPASSLLTVPVFAREGAIIPRGDILQANNDWDATGKKPWRARLRVELFPSVKVPNRFEYFDGSSLRSIRAGFRGGNLEISVDDLRSPVELDIYLKGFRSVTKDGAPIVAGRDMGFQAAKHLLRLKISGPAEVTVHGARDLFAAREATGG